MRLVLDTNVVVAAAILIMAAAANVGAAHGRERRRHKQHRGRGPLPHDHSLATIRIAVVAALLWHGPPRRLLDRCIDRDDLVFVSSPVLIAELAHTLGYRKFRDAAR